MKLVPAAAALVSLAVLRWFGGSGRGSNRQFDCCVCGRSGTTLLLLRLWSADLAALVVRWLLGGGGWVSPVGVALIHLPQ